jgi:hypothetical protein
MSRQSEKFLIGQSRKFLLTAARLKDERIAMSQEERDELEMAEARAGQSDQPARAARDWGQRSWVRKLLTRMKQQGDPVVCTVARSGVKPKIEARTREQAIEILNQADWHDVGPTFASEQLASA